MKFKAPVVAAVTALAIFLPTAVLGGNQSRAEKIAPCKTVPSAVAERRQATWKWEHKIDLRRTPTQFLEKEANTCKRLRYLKRKWSLRAHKRYTLVRTLETEPKAAIRWVFGQYANQALDVAWCESRYSIWAENGQYLGLFQMGSSERRLFGHGYTAYEQAVAAERYFINSGRDWSPWQCRPNGGMGW